MLVNNDGQDWATEGRCVAILLDMKQNKTVRLSATGPIRLWCVSAADVCVTQHEDDHQ